MGGLKDAAVVILSLAGGVGLGFLWNSMRPADPIELVAGVSVISVGLIYFALISMGKH
ncbi:hypothetical protein JW721_01355 [Candidatus Micrarchaeota archaeon]|nr:hypothetical protein [Candidatus Micrarchaeota archaeon]